MSKRNRNPIKNTLVDIALLTCGLVDVPVFENCASAIKTEMESIKSSFYANFNGMLPESKEPFTKIVNTIENSKIRYGNPRTGFGEGANIAVRQGTSPLVLFISDDIILHKGTLEKLVRRMDDPEIGLCGLKLTFPKDSTDPNRPAGRVQHIGHAVDVSGEIVHPLMGWSPENPKCNVSREVQSVTGGVFMVRRNLFLKIGGFFPGYGLGYYEDVDLCFNIRRAGAKVFIDTSCTADHVTSASYIKAGQPISMDTNKMLLRSRWAGSMQNDTWGFW